MFKYVQSLDTILANLKTANITIAKAMFWFYCFRIKIVSYICNSKELHLDIFKVLKIFDWLKYIDIITVGVFIDIDVYYQIWIKDFAQVAIFIYRSFKKNSVFE